MALRSGLLGQSHCLCASLREELADPCVLVLVDRCVNKLSQLHWHAIDALLVVDPCVNILSQLPRRDIDALILVDPCVDIVSQLDMHDNDDIIVVDPLARFVEGSFAWSRGAGCFCSMLHSSASASLNGVVPSS